MPIEISEIQDRKSEPLILVVPAKPDLERDAVVAAWKASYGETLLLDRFWEPPELPSHRVRVYGGAAFCMILAEKLNLRLVTPADEFMARVDARFLHRGITIVDLETVLTSRLPAFIEPVIPKQFAAAVYESSAALGEATEGLQGDTMVFLCEVVDFLCEVRTFVLDGKVQTASVYEGTGVVSEAIDFVKDFARGASLPKTAVVDVGVLRNGKWSVIETNATWGSGLNGCNPNAVCRCLMHASGGV